jgi:hypothetical protein
MLELLLSRAIEHGVADSLRRLVAAAERAWQVDRNRPSTRTR